MDRECDDGKGEAGMEKKGQRMAPENFILPVNVLTVVFFFFFFCCTDR